MAFRTQAPVVLDLIFILTSLVLAIVVATLGLALAATRRRWARAAGGGIIGVAISTIHYLGMSAYRLSRRGMWRVLESTLATSVGAGLWWDHRNARLHDHDHSCGCYRQSARSNGRELRASVPMVEPALRRETVNGEVIESSDVQGWGCCIGSVVQGMSIQARDGARGAELVSVAQIASEAIETLRSAKLWFLRNWGLCEMSSASGRYGYLKIAGFPALALCKRRSNFSIAAPDSVNSSSRSPLPSPTIRPSADRCMSQRDATAGEI